MITGPVRLIRDSTVGVFQGLNISSIVSKKQGGQQENGSVTPK